MITGTEIFYIVSLDFLKTPEKYLNIGCVAGIAHCFDFVVVHVVAVFHCLCLAALLERTP